MLDSAPAYPLTIIRVRLGRFGRCFGVCVCYVRGVRIFLFEVALSGSGFSTYWSVFAVPLWSVCPLCRLRLLCPATFGYSCLRSPCLVPHFARCLEVGRRPVGSGIHEVLIGATVRPRSNRICEPWSVFRRTAVVPMFSLASALVMSGGIWNFMFKVSVSVLGFTRCLDVPPFGP